jgi:hypothetical protein
MDTSTPSTCISSAASGSTASLKCSARLATLWGVAPACQMARSGPPVVGELAVSLVSGPTRSSRRRRPRGREPVFRAPARRRGSRR